MRDRTRNRVALAAAVTIAAAATPAISFACCPSGGNGGDLATKAATSGLEQSSPATTDVSGDPNWAVYQFTRGGVSYTRIDDAYGRVRAVVANIGSTAWVLPMGSDVDRVLLPGDVLPVGDRRTIYKSTKVEVAEIQTTAGPYWFIAPTEGSAY